MTSSKTARVNKRAYTCANKSECSSQTRELFSLHQHTTLLLFKLNTYNSVGLSRLHHEGDVLEYLSLRAVVETHVPKLQLALGSNQRVGMWSVLEIKTLEMI